MSSNSRKTARLLSLKKKVQERRAATGGPKGDFYSIGNVVKDEYGALFMIERYQNGKWIVVALGPKSNDKKNPYQKVIRKEIVVPREEMTYAIKNVSDAEMVSLVVSQQGIPAAQSPRADVRMNASPRSRAYRGIEAPPADASIPTNFGCSSDA